MRDPFLQTWGIGRGSRRMACSLRQGAGNLWTTTYWWAVAKRARRHQQRNQPHPTTTRQESACAVSGRVCASAFGLRSNMRRHKETRWAASSSNRRTTKRGDAMSVCDVIIVSTISRMLRTVAAVASIFLTLRRWSRARVLPLKAAESFRVTSQCT